MDTTTGAEDTDEAQHDNHDWINPDMMSLMKAIDNHDASKVARLLNEGVDANSTGSDDSSLLSYAAMMQFKPAIKLLLDHGADPNSAINWICLHWAIKDCCTEIVEMLLQAGCDPNTVDSNSGSATPLTRAVIVGSVECAELLLAAGADINGIGLLGDTPLKCAIRHQKLELIHFLLHRGARPSVYPVNNTSCLQLAMKSREVDFELFMDIYRSIKKEILRPLPPVLVDHFSNVLLSGLQQKQEKKVEFLFGRLIKPFDYDLYLRFIPAYFTYSDCVQIMQIEIDLVPPSEQIPRSHLLAQAVVNGRRDLTKLLIQHGANPNFMMRLPGNELPILNTALYYKQYATATGLIQANCDTKNMISPIELIHFERHHKSLDKIIGLIHILYDAGCDVSCLRCIPDVKLQLLSTTNQAWLQHILKNPRSLQEWARISVRRNWGFQYPSGALEKANEDIKPPKLFRTMFHGITKLPIAGSLKSYLMLQGHYYSIL